MEDRICHRTLINVGFMEDVSVEQINAIRAELNNLHHKQSTIFDQNDPIVKRYAEDLWRRLITEKKLMPIG